MVFSIIIILFIGVIAYFHFVQGFFSATISAMISVLAAVLAVSYNETVVNFLLKGKMADDAHAMVLCMIFAVVYIVLRVIFDSAIPGNVRTPSTVDKVGAAVMGVISGIFVTGIFAIAVQMLPFDPGISFMGYSRYSIHGERGVYLPTKGVTLDAKVDNEMDDTMMTPEKEKGLLLPVDDWVLGTVYHLSDGGSLSNDNPLASVHPDYLQELFGERLGIQTGARRVALDFPGTQTVDVSGVFTAASLPARDGALKELRSPTYTPIVNLSKDGVGVVKPDPGQRILVVRIKVKAGASDDDDSLFRFSTGSIHLVGKTSNGYKDFYPIGTLQNGNTVLLNKADDFLFAKLDTAFDVVFLVDDSLLVGGKDLNKIAPGTLLTVKRFANLDLSGTDVKESIPTEAGVGTILQPIYLDHLKLPPPAPAVTTRPPVAAPSSPVASPVAAPSTPVAPAAPETPAAPQTLPGKDIAQSIKATLDGGILIPAPPFRGIGIGIADATATDTPVAGGTVSFGRSPGAITVAKIDPTAALAKLGEGTTALTQFFCPPDRTMVQITVHPYTAGWDWMAQIGTTKLIDTNGNKYAPVGCYALAKTGDAEGLFLRYDWDHTNFAVSPPDGAAAGDVYFVFLIPKDTDLKTFTMAAMQQDLDSQTHVP